MICPSLCFFELPLYFSRPPTDQDRMRSVRRYASLALISFLSLYLELVVIRWLASEVRIFAYFKNFPLMAAFLGSAQGACLRNASAIIFAIGHSCFSSFPL